MIAGTPFRQSLKKPGVTLCFFILLLTACKDQDKKDVKAVETTTPTTANRFIDPPIKSADVPYEEYEVDATKGDTLVYPTGSIILFPPNAFVDETGKPVTGKVQVKYREFKDPVDFFLAGIPMQYDSAGGVYQFVSSGMLDIRAFKDGKPVFVNQAAKPEINLAGKDNPGGHSLYFLDTIQQKWINKGMMQITERRGQNKRSQSTATVTLNELPEPVKPQKANNKSPVLRIEIDPSSFKEFAMYKNTKFQVDESKTPFNVKDSEEEWNNLELLKGAQRGSYIARFSNATKTATYAVRPVFEGADYDLAVKAFEVQSELYKKQGEERANRDRAAQQKYISDSIKYNQLIAENKRIERLNAIIIQKNREIEQQNELIAQSNKEIEKLNVVTAKRNLENEQRKADYAKKVVELEKENERRRVQLEKENEKMKVEIEKENERRRENVKRENRNFAATMATLGDVYKSFEIDGFGYWNCDATTRFKTISVKATFKDKQGNVLQLGYVTVINRSVNSIYRPSSDELLIAPTADNMILAVWKNQFAFVSYDEVRKLNINDKTKEQTFIVEIVDEHDLNYRYIRSLIKQ
jgi:hypothetical protein